MVKIKKKISEKIGKVIETPEAIVDSFTKSQDKNEFLEILLKLFDRENIELITDLSDDEIKLITRIRTIASLKKIDIYEDALICYMELRLSSNRKSRKEIVETVKGYVHGMAMNRMRGIGGMFGGKNSY